MSYVLERCPGCEATSPRQLCITRDRHYGIKGDYKVVQCATCELVFLNPMYEDSELAPLYPLDYYAYEGRFHQSNGIKQLLKKLLGYAAGTKDPKFEQPGKVLDVGCGSGWFLARMREQGWEPYGVEISEIAARVGREQAGLQISQGTLLDANFPAAFFDFVRLNHSFEHMSRPNETLREIFRILKPRGRVFVGVPNHASFNARIFGRYWWYLGVPVHPFGYSVGNLTALITRSGLHVETVTYNSDFSGILGSMQIWLNRNNSKRSTEGFVFNSLPLRILCHWIAKIFDGCKRGDAIEIVASKTTRCEC
jgi:SAM-dependent methyltransferase